MDAKCLHGFKKQLCKVIEVKSIEYKYSTKIPPLTLEFLQPQITENWEYFRVASVQVGLILHSPLSVCCWSLPVTGYRVRTGFFSHPTQPFSCCCHNKGKFMLSVTFERLPELLWIHQCILSVRQVTAEPLVSQVKGKGLDPLLLLICQLHINPQFLWAAARGGECRRSDTKEFSVVFNSFYNCVIKSSVYLAMPQAISIMEVWMKHQLLISENIPTTLFQSKLFIFSTLG